MSDADLKEKIVEGWFGTENEITREEIIRKGGNNERT